jgi:hypothetical protein
LSEHKIRWQLRPTVHDPIRVMRVRFRSEAERGEGNSNEGEKGGMPNEQFHGVTLPQGIHVKISLTDLSARA